MWRPLLPQRLIAVACHNPSPRGTALWTLAMVLAALTGAAWADWHAPHHSRPPGRTAPISAKGAVGAPLPGAPLPGAIA
ncbi:hypothetical protein [Novosphingobium humi]|uniref:hypothetical protein n=1 Tax=Novosphingobium humi TaxID=2282397 RepID=UPI0025B158F6|nr:hypothetical protein [Novosphingobium humi]WJS97218.1 hypothetical protein NYQ05_08540 [Novosphingobium humi]